jgi:CHASE2 domain-containing sensor protein
MKKNKEIIKRYFYHISLLFIISIPLSILKVIKDFNPVEKIFADIQFSDLYYQEKHLENKKSDEIYIVDIGIDKSIDKTRKKISDFLKEVNHNEFRPKVIGIDLFLNSYNNYETDSLLSIELKESNVILSSQIEIFKDETEHKTYANFPRKLFLNNNPCGFTNLGDKIEDHEKTVRFFIPEIEINKKTYRHFSIEVAKKFNYSKFNYFENSISTDIPCVINYNSSFKENRIDVNEINNFEFLKNKIVLIGLYSLDKNKQPTHIEDLHFTPTNYRMIGKSFPDMYGIEIHANIIQSIIDENLVKSNKTINFIIEIFLGLFIYYLFLKFYFISKRGFMILRFFLQIFTVVILVMLSFYQPTIYLFNIQVDYTLLALICFFSSEIMIFNENIINKQVPKILNFLKK